MQSSPKEKVAFGLL